METTHVSSKGQVIIPKPLRLAHHWKTGQELVAIDVGNGILLKPKTPFPPTTIHEVAGCLPYGKKAKTLIDMDEAIRQAIKERFHDRG